MVVKKQKKYKTLKWLGGIVFFFCLLSVASAWYISAKLRPAITAELKSRFYNATDSLYRIDFEILHTNLITGNASLVHVKISPDTVRYQKMVALKRAPNNLYYVYLRKLEIKNFHPLRIYREKKLNIEQILFEKPIVKMVNKQLDFNEEKPFKALKSPFIYI